MSPEQLTALLGALTALLGATAVVLRQIHELRKDLNGRMSELLEERSAAAHRKGELEGRDFMRRVLTPPPDTPENAPGEP